MYRVVSGAPDSRHAPSESTVDTEMLRVLLQVADSGSIQGAARILGATRSSLRRSLDALEAEVGVPLLHRDASGIRLTAAGAVVVEQGRSLLEASRTLVSNARAASGEASGVIRIFEPVGLPLSMHVRILLATHLGLPNLRLEVRHLENPMAHIQEPFELMLHEGPAPELGTWFSRVVLRAPLGLVAARSYIQRRGMPQDAAELPDHETLGWKRPGVAADEWPLLAGGTSKIQPWLTSADPQLLRSVAADGGGIFLGPRIPLFDEPVAEPMESILPDQVGGELVFRVSTPFPTRGDSRTRDTVAMLISHLENLPKD